MTGLEYHHIGHDPAHGEIALWSVDDHGTLHEDRRRFRETDVEWLNWSHERVFPEVNWTAVGRVEFGRQAGSIHISDPDIGRSPMRLRRLVGTLERQYPKVKWFLFGSGYKGESVFAALAQRVASDELARERAAEASLHEDRQRRAAAAHARPEIVTRVGKRGPSPKKASAAKTSPSPRRGPSPSKARSVTEVKPIRSRRQPKA